MPQTQQHEIRPCIEDQCSPLANACAKGKSFLKERDEEVKSVLWHKKCKQQPYSNLSKELAQIVRQTSTHTQSLRGLGDDIHSLPFFAQFMHVIKVTVELQC